MADDMMRGVRFLLLSLAALLAGCATAHMPLPVLAEPVALRVAYIHNPALPELPAGFVDAVLREATAMTKEHLGVQVRFVPGPRQAIADAFGSFTAEQEAEIAKAVYGYRNEGDRARLVAAMRAGLERRGDFAKVLAEARPWLSGPRTPANRDELAEALVDTQLARLEGWKAHTGSGAYHLFPGWVYAARSRPWPFELAVTNQLVASAEYDWMELVTVSRAGITNGITTQSPGGAFGLVSVLTLFPFTSNDPHTLALRGGKRGGGPDAVRWAAALLVHELGHHLLHFYHPYGNKACVMNPPPTLQYDEWVAALDASACRVGSSAAMKPGAVKFIKLPAPAQ